MEKFNIEYSDNVITNNAGLLLVGTIINSPEFKNAIDSVGYSNKNISDYDIIKSYLGLLSLGKNSYESIDAYKNDELFKRTLEISVVPSKETLRQRLEELSKKTVERVVKIFNTQVIKSYGVLETCLNTDMIPVDFDVSPFDNSNSKKEGVGWTYKHVVGYSPMLTYIGGTGFMLNNELRCGTDHSNCKGTDDYIKTTLEYAREITSKNLLARFDSGNDSVKNIFVIEEFEDVNYLIKRNFRHESPQSCIDLAKSEGCTKEKVREGEIIYYNSKIVPLSLKDERGNIIKTTKSRLVVRLKERTIDNIGQYFLIPDYEISAWYTDLGETYKDKEVVELYKDHGTSEQFHSEFKTDMDMERFPSGKFKTNSLVITLGMLVFNLLRAIGQETLNSEQLQRKRKVKRVRIRKVLQDIMYMACQFMIKCKIKTLKLARFNIFGNAFIFAYNKFVFR